MMLYDAQVRLGECLFGYHLDLETLKARMEQHQIGRAVLCPVRPMDYDLAKANDAISVAVANDPASFSGFARVDPWQGSNALIELNRAITGLQLRGLLLDPWEDHFVISDPMVDPVIKAAGELGIPVMVAGGYPNFSHPSQIAALASRHPSVTFIATHGGQLNISGLLLADAQAVLRSCANIIIETSGIYREDFIEDCIDEFGAHRVVFGSGTPVFDQGFETLRIRSAHVGNDVKQHIGWDNIARLVGAEGAGHQPA